jgi:hypothetical protein
VHDRGVRWLLVTVVACSHAPPAPHAPHRASTRLRSCQEEHYGPQPPVVDEYVGSTGSQLGAVRGELADSYARPIVGATVVAFGYGGDEFEATTDASGTFERRELKPGQYHVMYNTDAGRYSHAVTVRPGLVTISRIERLDKAIAAEKICRELGSHF